MSTPARAAGALILIPTNLTTPFDPASTLPAAHLATVKSISHFVVENAKSARAFLKAIDIGRPLMDIRIDEIDARTPEGDLAKFLEPTRGGFDVGLMSEAGAPAVADPGAALVDAAHRAKVRVVPLIGPSAILLALMASGLNGQNFAFQGYLPSDTAGRVKAIQDLERESKAKRRTQLFIETPYRNQVLLADLLKTLAPGTRLCIAIDVTGQSERIVQATVAELRRAPPELAKIPAMFLFQA